jgi:DNA polymerase
MMTWGELENACMSCRRCALYETRTNVVFGVGNPNADVLFVGEGPGEQEDLKGEPFVGRAGRLLDDMLKIINLDRKKNTISRTSSNAARRTTGIPSTLSGSLHRLSAHAVSAHRPKLVVCLGESPRCASSARTSNHAGPRQMVL